MFVHFEKIIDKLDMELYKASVPLRLYLGNCPQYSAALYRFLVFTRIKLLKISSSIFCFW